MMHALRSVHRMESPLVIERTVELDLPVDELWRLMSTASGWREWMVDTAEIDTLDIDLVGGAEGTVFDDGIERRLRVVRVDEGRSISFVWSEVGGDDERPSAVTIRLDEAADGRRRLVIREEWPAGACADCPLRAADRWDLRACLLCIASQSTCAV